MNEREKRELDELNKTLKAGFKDMGKWLGAIEKAILDRDAIDTQTRKLKASTDRLSEAVAANDIAQD